MRDKLYTVDHMQGTEQEPCTKGVSEEEEIKLCAYIGLFKIVGLRRVGF